MTSLPSACSVCWIAVQTFTLIQQFDFRSTRRNRGGLENILLNLWFVLSPLKLTDLKVIKSDFQSKQDNTKLNASYFAICIEENGISCGSPPFVSLCCRLFVRLYQKLAELVKIVLLWNVLAFLFVNGIFLDRYLFVENGSFILVRFIVFHFISCGFILMSTTPALTLPAPKKNGWLTLHLSGM